MTENRQNGSVAGCNEVKQALEYALQAVLQARSLMDRLPCACGQCEKVTGNAEQAPNWMYGQPPDLL